MIRAAMLLGLMMGTTACLDGRQAVEEAPADAGPRAAEDEDRSDPAMGRGSLRVEYRSSYRPGQWEQAVSALGVNDLFKFASNTAWLTIRPPSNDRITWLRIHRGDSLLLEMPVAGGLGELVTLVVDLETETWPEGIHTMTYSARTAGGTDVVGQEEVRVHFNVTSMDADDADPHLLWIGTFEVGLLAYHLGDDPIDPADDTVQHYGGHALNRVDFEPPRGRPWQGEGGYERQSEPAGQLTLSIHHAQGGVFAGAAWRGVSYLDDGGTPFDRRDDRYALFHPGMNLDPDSPQAGMANCVSAIVPDGENGLWLGTFDGLFYVDHKGTLFHEADDEWIRFDSEATYDPNIAHMAIDDDGRVWLVSFDLTGARLSGNTVVVLDPGDDPLDTADDTWGRLALPEGFPAEGTTVLVDDAAVWIGTGDGLWRLDHGGTPFDPEDDVWQRFGLDTGLLDDDIGALSMRDDGRLWIGTFDVCRGNGGGLSLFDPDRCAPDTPCPPEVSYTVEDGLLDDDVSSIVPLPGGAVAFGTFNALAAPLIAGLTGNADGQACEPDDDPERNLNGALDPTRVGQDGLSVIDPGDDLASKDDDALVNL